MEFFNKILEKEFIQQIIKDYGKVYFVGGCVRDYLLNKEPKDIDIVVGDKSYSILISILEQYGKVDTVGESFGVIKFKEFETNFEVEIALPRTDSKNTDLKGHKSIVAQSNPFMPIEYDLKRRDFTINSIALDENLCFIDPYEGRYHLDLKLIKATNVNAFSDDPLRMLRAVQFASRFDFQLDKQTELLIYSHAEKIKEISPERILMEFQKVFDKKGNIKTFLQLLNSTKLFESIFGYHISQAIGFSKGSTFTDAEFSKISTLAEFLYFCSDSITGVSIESLKEKFKLENETIKQIKAIDHFFNKPVKFIKGEFNKLCFETLQIYPNAYELGILKDYFHNFIQKGYPKKYNELCVSGKDIIDFLELQEGPIVGIVQKALLEEVLSDTVINRTPFVYDFLNLYKENHL